LQQFGWAETGLTAMNFSAATLHLDHLKQAVLTGLLAVAPLFTAVANRATAAIPVPQATATARVEQRQQEVQQIRPENFDLKLHPVTDANASFWRNILWTTAIVEPQETYVGTAIGQILDLTSGTRLSNAQTRTVDMAMQVGTQLYLSNPTVYADLGDRFAQIIAQSQDPMWVAMSLSALDKAGVAPNQLQQLGDRTKQRFPRWQSDIYLYSTLRDLDELSRPSAIPPLNDLLSWTIAPGQPQMYVFCRPDRATLCQAVLKDGNGQFVQQSGVQQNGQLWSVPLLLRSLHGLSWVFTRGETPQGIYRIQGTVPQPDTDYFRAFGQFPLVNLFVPFEPGVREFVPGRKGTLTGNLTAYQALLPPSWRGYFPIQETYWAGKAGRSAFRIHGSGEAPSFFSNNRRYVASTGWNPTIGCLSALELYDDTGQVQQADMPKILDALTAIGGKQFTGYLIVVDLPGNSNTPISLAEIESAMQAQSK
jgi:hypothetical protein